MCSKAWLKEIAKNEEITEMY